ncbi:MAG: hypothetical protein ACKVOP_09720 [Sphingomonadaceae bacterium]
MSEWFASGRAIDLVIAVMLAEAVLLIALGRKPLTVILTILPGAAILLAARAALTGASWHWVALWLTVSLPLHLADLRHRKLI